MIWRTMTQDYHHYDETNVPGPSTSKEWEEELLVVGGAMIFLINILIVMRLFQGY